MASSTPMRDIDERFLNCSICLEQLKRPKLLPCGHSYCRDCLHQSVTRGDVRIKCPICRTVSTLPLTGVDGFPNDFNTQNIIEFVQAHQSAQTEERRESEGGQISERCHNCPGKRMVLTCSTCGRVPLCVLCGISSHRSHDLGSGTSLTRERLASLTLGKSSSATQAREVCVDITPRAEYVVDIQTKMAREGWSITGITGNDAGYIAVTGEASSYQSHITVLDIAGRVISQKVTVCRPESGSRYCDFLLGSRVATVCFDNEIGVYDFMDDTYRKTHIADAVRTCSRDWLVSCIATDRVNNVFYVGGKNSRTVYVFTGDVHHKFTFRLPRPTKWPRDMAVHGDKLLVCDWEGKRAFAVTVKESECKFDREFAKPSREAQQPHSVCTDSKGFIYMVWETASSSTLAQYSRDGRHLLLTRPLNWPYDRLFVAAVRIEEGEKLVMPTGKGQLIVYGLVETDSLGTTTI